MQIKLYTDFEELRGIEDEWDRLVSRSDDPQIFYHWAWIDAYYKAGMKDGAKPFIVSVWSNNQLVGIAPLKIAIKNSGLLKMRLLTNFLTEFIDYSTFMIDKTLNVKTVLKRICVCILEHQGEWDVIKLYNFNSNSRSTWVLQEIMANAGFVDVGSYVGVVASYIDLNTDYERVFSKKQLKNIERRRKKAEKEFRVETVIGQSIKAEYWEKLLDFHKSAWNKKGFSDDSSQLFYKELIDHRIIKENTEFSYLLLNDTLAAGHFGFLYNNKVYYYIPSYDKNYSKYGVGQILLQEMIDYYKDRGFDTFDFLRGDESYKDGWTERCQFLYIFGAVSPAASFIHRVVMNVNMALNTIPMLKKLYRKIRR